MQIVLRRFMPTHFRNAFRGTFQNTFEYEKLKIHSNVSQNVNFDLTEIVFRNVSTNSNLEEVDCIERIRAR